MGRSLIKGLYFVSGDNIITIALIENKNYKGAIMSNTTGLKKLEKRHVLYLISALLTTAYLIYLLVHFGNNAANSKTNEQAIGAGLAIVIVFPHMVLVGIGYIFNWLAYALKENWAGLVAGILYSVSILFMPIYFFFVVAQLVLCFVAYAKIKRKREALKTTPQQVAVNTVEE